ncbi:RNA pseudouridine synthase [[Phormidium ambiguum] IAM M-71]|uniref:RNA pseudouridylate synthase n=1 Tax=[Phormidium ambiguum] IAM M-71 TaxID=454136 RepID=A0A1U7IJF9_9CYAN|nr:RluA family pseudouridine synthase [Phormidium ambiguum]OKH37354.1 RNA pseudouridine synthase [Phormidium ambiguum IAM M-71]
MLILHPLNDFLPNNFTVSDSSINYWYQGYCPQTGDLLKLPRTPLAEAIANSLMQQMKIDDRFSREGKMYGILIVELPNKELGILKAFSGLLNGFSVVEGWVPPIPGREELVSEESRTLEQLEAIKNELIRLKQFPERAEYERLLREFEGKLHEISDRHQHSKQQRQEKRQLLCQTLTGEALNQALEELNQQSRLEGIEKRQLKRQRDAILQPIKQLIARSDTQIRELKKQRQELSRQLQTQMHAVYSLTNFSGKSLTLQQLMPAGLPTGTGDCCAPKLLHYAATHNLKPLAMAEFWWGKSSVNGDKIAGEFYEACVERCQPIMGFLLSGMTPGKPREKIDILYEDEWLIAVNKPAGLLSVPGRYSYNQDSVVSRLRQLLLDGKMLTAVHRLDRETSGILLLARHQETYRQLSQQFAQRQVRKVYEAVLSGVLLIDKGAIELPLWGNPENRPLQTVNWQFGKPSLTHFQVISREGNYTRVEFFPVTGRTHQIRVHAADSQGLGMVILGDRLYGCNANVDRLHLHAKEICFQHPHLRESLTIQAKTPF